MNLFDVIKDWGLGYAYFVGTALDRIVFAGTPTGDVAVVEGDYLDDAILCLEQALQCPRVVEHTHSRISAAGLAEDMRLRSDLLNVVSLIRSGLLEDAICELRYIRNEDLPSRTNGEK